MNRTLIFLLLLVILLPTHTYAATEFEDGWQPIECQSHQYYINSKDNTDANTNSTFPKFYQCGICKLRTDIIIKDTPSWEGGNNVYDSYCPWSIFCPENTYFNQECIQCAEHHSNPAFYVRFSGGPQGTLSAKTTCPPNIYTITLRHNTPCNLSQSDTKIYEKYGVGFARQQSGPEWFSTSPLPEASMPSCNKYSLLRYTDSNNNNILQPNGKFFDGINSTTFTDNTDLRGVWQENTYTITYSPTLDGKAWEQSQKCSYNPPKKMRVVGGCTCRVKNWAEVTNATHAGQGGKHFIGWYCQHKNTNGTYSACAGITTTTVLEPGVGCLSEFDGDVPSNYVLYPAYETCPAGYYCTDGQRYKCPVGTTSDAGADEQTDCYYTGGTSGTKFCDKNGCFTLPADVTIKYKPGVVQ